MYWTYTFLLTVILRNVLNLQNVSYDNELYTVACDQDV